MNTPLNALTISQLQEGYQKRSFSVLEVAKATIARIDKLNPLLKAFLFFDPDAVRAQAEKLDATPAAIAEKPLFGVPIAIKDNISTKGIPTTAGSKILNGYSPIYDAEVIRRLKAAGAIILGKTNLDEFAMGSSTENSAFGPTRNPWNTECVPGGSSGGSAVSVAAQIAPIALGSDTGGSIRQPAALTGILGLKCTYGLVSRNGLIAYASSLDQIGPFARCVDDLALCLQAIAGHDPLDSTSCPTAGATPFAPVPVSSLKGMKAGLPREFFGAGLNADVAKKIDEAVRALTALGVTIEECSLPQLSNALAAYYIIAPAEASSNLARFDGVRYGPREKGNDIIEMYSNTRGTAFGTEVQRRILLGTFVLSSGYYDAYYLKAMKVRRLITKEFEAAFSRYDFLISPTTPTPAFKIGEKADNPLEMYLSDIYTISANLAGIPALSVPCGQVNALPVGIQFLAGRFQEPTLLKVAQAYLTETRHHLAQPPLCAEAS